MGNYISACSLKALVPLVCAVKYRLIDNKAVVQPACMYGPTGSCFTQRQTARLRITLTFLLTLLKPRHPQQLASGTCMCVLTYVSYICLCYCAAQELNCAKSHSGKYKELHQTEGGGLLETPSKACTNADSGSGKVCSRAHNNISK